MFLFCFFLQKNLFEDNGRDDENKRKYETGVRKKTKRKSMKISKGKQVEMVTKEGEVSDSEGELSEGEVSDSVLGSERNTCQLMMEDAKSDMDWLKSKVSEAKVNTLLLLVVKIKFQHCFKDVFANSVKSRPHAK